MRFSVLAEFFLAVLDDFFLGFAVSNIIYPNAPMPPSVINEKVRIIELQLYMYQSDQESKHFSLSKNV